MRTEQCSTRAYSRKPNKIPGVVIPDAGLSYNPDDKSHTGLLKKAGQYEIKRSVVNKHQHKAINENFPKVLEKHFFIHNTWII